MPSTIVVFGWLGMGAGITGRRASAADGGRGSASPVPPVVDARLARALPFVFIIPLPLVLRKVSLGSSVALSAPRVSGIAAGRDVFLCGSVSMTTSIFALPFPFGFPCTAKFFFASRALNDTPGPRLRGVLSMRTYTWVAGLGFNFAVDLGSGLASVRPRERVVGAIVAQLSCKRVTSMRSLILREYV